MMEGSALFPDGHPAVLKESSPDLSGDARYITRLAAAKPVKYYFIDFGISTEGCDTVLGYDGQVGAPELSGLVEYNPYKLEVFFLAQHFMMCSSR